MIDEQLISGHERGVSIFHLCRVSLCKIGIAYNKHLPFSVRKKAPTQTGGTEAATGFTPRVDALGKPLQTDLNGPCKRQGCPFPRRIDESTGKVFDYCGRTCAIKDSGPQRSPAMCSKGAIFTILFLEFKLCL